jgi:hypothetical protein
MIAARPTDCPKSTTRNIINHRLPGLGQSCRARHDLSLGLSLLNLVSWGACVYPCLVRASTASTSITTRPFVSSSTHPACALSIVSPTTLTCPVFQFHFGSLCHLRPTDQTSACQFSCSSDCCGSHGFHGRRLPQALVPPDTASHKGTDWNISPSTHPNW